MGSRARSSCRSRSLGRSWSRCSSCCSKSRRWCHRRRSRRAPARRLEVRSSFRRLCPDRCGPRCARRCWRSTGSSHRTQLQTADRHHLVMRKPSRHLSPGRSGSRCSRRIRAPRCSSRRMRSTSGVAPTNAKLVPAPVIGSIRVTLFVFWFVVHTYRPSNATPLGPLAPAGSSIVSRPASAYHANVAICDSL